MNFEKPEKSEFWKNEKKKKKMLEISSFYPCVPKDRIFLSFWAIFCRLTLHLPNNPENQNFEMKKAFVDVINLCNKKYDHMVYAYSDTEPDRHFCSFTPRLTPKMKIWKKCKNHLDILSFYTYVP